MNIVDRRPNPKGKSLSNRQRFLGRARAEVKSAVQEALRKRKPPSGMRCAHCRRALAAYKIPRLVKFVNEADLPLTVTGKLQKNKLAEFFR